MTCSYCSQRSVNDLLHHSSICLCIVLSIPTNSTTKSDCFLVSNKLFPLTTKQKYGVGLSMSQKVSKSAQIFFLTNPAYGTHLICLCLWIVEQKPMKSPYRQKLTETVRNRPKQTAFGQINPRQQINRQSDLLT